jgi:hypothetical protein
VERWEPSPSAPPASANGGVSPGVLLATIGPRPWLYIVGAVLAFISATLSLASLVGPHGRAQVIEDLIGQGFPIRNQGAMVAIVAMVRVAAPLLGGVLHAVAFHGLRRSRRWGWVAAVVVAAAWSVLLVGIPILFLLLRRDVRNTFGLR